MSEIQLLNFLLAIAFVLGSTLTRKLLLVDASWYRSAFWLAVAVHVLGGMAGWDQAVIVWPLFCIYGGLLYTRSTQRLLSFRAMSGAIPFVFSVIASVWLASGTLDLRLLGYGPAWSFYAALHGSFLGWIFIGCLVALSRRSNTGPIYVLGSYVCSFLFLMVAFGIDGVPYVKRIGAVSLTLLVPALLGRYLYDLKPYHGPAVTLAWVSLLSAFVSMSLALANEFGIAFQFGALGIPTMVLVHGVLNALITVPAFAISVLMLHARD